MRSYLRRNPSVSQPPFLVLRAFTARGTFSSVRPCCAQVTQPFGSVSSTACSQLGDQGWRAPVRKEQRSCCCWRIHRRCLVRRCVSPRRPGRSGSPRWMGRAQADQDGWLHRGSDTVRSLSQVMASFHKLYPQLGIAVMRAPGFSSN